MAAREETKKKKKKKSSRKERRQEEQPRRRNGWLVLLFVGVVVVGCSNLHLFSEKRLLYQVESLAKVRGWSSNLTTAKGNATTAAARIQQQKSAVVESTTTLQPPPEFMTAQSMVHKLQGNPHYSGMWWANRDVVSRIKTPEQMTSLEVGSMAAFDAVGGTSKVLMTRDWLDFSVEHLSRYMKQIPIDEDEAYKRLRKLLIRYIKRAAAQPRHEKPSEENSAVSRTLAVIPLYGTNETSTIVDDYKVLPPSNLRLAALNGFSLAATLMSLSKLRIPRVVIVGNHEEPPLEVRIASKVFFQTEEDPLQISYIYAKSKGKSNHLIIPAFALSMLQHAFKGNMTKQEQAAWFGKGVSPNNPQKWGYVYFTEADLILHTRTSAQAAIKRQLDRGLLLAAHRLQPLPHVVDYPDSYWKGGFIPSLGPFANFSNLDTETDACCDQGNWYPGRDPKLFDWCWMWYQCGIEKRHSPPKNESESLKRFERQAVYPTIRISNGFDVMVLAESARACAPAKRGTCGASDGNDSAY